MTAPSALRAPLLLLGPNTHSNRAARATPEAQP